MGNIFYFIEYNMSEFFNRYKNLFLRDDESFLNPERFNSEIKERPSIKATKYIPDFSILDEGISFERNNKSTVAEKSKYIVELEKEVLPKLNRNNMHLDNYKLKTEPSTYKPSFQYSLPPLQPIKWNFKKSYLPETKIEQMPYNFYTPTKPIEKIYQKPIPTELGNRRNNIFSFDNEDVMKKTVFKSRKIPLRFKQIPQIQKTLKRQDPRNVSPAGFSILQQTRKASRSKSPQNLNTPSKFLEFSQYKVNNFQFLNRRLEDMKKIEKFNYRYKLNEYRDALEKRREVKRDQSRKLKLAAIFAQENQLKQVRLYP